MKFILLLVLFSLVGASLLFYFSQNFSAEIPSDINNEKVIGIIDAPVDTPAQHLDHEDEEEKELKEEIVNALKEEKEIIAEVIESEPEPTAIEVQKAPPVNNPDIKKMETVVVNKPKKVEPKIKESFKASEQKEHIISTSTGEYYLQEHLKAVSPYTYKNDMGQIQVKGQGYYFLSAQSKANNFPILVKKRNRSNLAIATGVITLKAKNQNIADSVAKKYQLTKVQYFPHLSLYIYKLNSTDNIASIYQKIKSESGIDNADLEILDKKLRAL